MPAEQPTYDGGYSRANRDATSHTIFELLIKKEPEALPVAQTRNLFEQGFRDIEKQVRTLVIDLVEDM
jgi:hypothetical protein